MKYDIKTTLITLIRVENRFRGVGTVEIGLKKETRAESVELELRTAESSRLSRRSCLLQVCHVVQHEAEACVGDFGLRREFKDHGSWVAGAAGCTADRRGLAPVRVGCRRGRSPGASCRHGSLQV